MTESSSSSSGIKVNIEDDDVYEPSEILVQHIGETDSETTVCGNGEDGSSCGDAAMPSSATTDSYPSTVMQQPTEMPAGLPSAERRRRRRRSNNILSNDYNFENDFRSITSRQGRRGDNWLKYDTAILGILLILAIRLLSRRNMIMQDIRRTRQDALINNRQIIFLPRYIRQIPLIVSILVKNLMSDDILQQSKQLITNPSQTPQILYELLISLWYLLGDFLQQLQYFLRSLPILRTLFGADMMVIGDEFVPDNIPELEDKSNNDVGDDNDKKANSVNGHGVTQATKPRSNSKSAIREVRYDINDLPPAFENEEDYPEGWLMYHPEHGVITRERFLELERGEAKQHVT